VIMQLSIVIVNYKAGALLIKCLDSIEAGGTPSLCEIVVVDNHSEDGAAAEVLRRYPAVRLIQNERNYGFGAAVNMGFRLTSGTYVLVLNPDIEVRPGSINRLVHYMESAPDVGVCAPKLLNPDGSLQYSCRTYYSVWTVLLRRTVLGRLWPDHPAVRAHLMMDWDHQTRREVDWVLGAALMLRRSALPSDGAMDERFFLYFEDVDLCLRLHKAGWRVVYDPMSVMIHHHQRASAHGMMNRAKLEHVRSWIKFSLKHRGEPLLRRVHAEPEVRRSC
jgi:N-acetylglucosaminyl-diphospho-decaprenol L-rhamnosyltransferase